jgi:hypothetical protein
VKEDFSPFTCFSFKQDYLTEDFAGKKAVENDKEIVSACCITERKLHIRKKEKSVYNANLKVCLVVKA